MKMVVLRFPRFSDVYNCHSRRILFLLGMLCGFIFSSVYENSTSTESMITLSSELELGEKQRGDLQVIEDASAEILRVGTGGKKYDRILCFVLTTPENTLKAKMVRSTWGRKCDKLIFMSSKTGAIGLPVKETRDTLWKKVELSVQYLHAKHLDEYDWFFKADDDTYTIMENMRRFLSPFDSSLPYFFGREFKVEGVDYRSGGAGYLLSREALRRVVELGLNKNECKTQPSDVNEDVNMGKCVKQVGGIFADSKDEFGRQRFIPYRINEFYSGDTHSIQYMEMQGIEYKLGYDCCSNEAITFHYISGYDMQVYEYLLYKLNIANVSKYI